MIIHRKIEINPEEVLDQQVKKKEKLNEYCKIRLHYIGIRV